MEIVSLRGAADLDCKDKVSACDMPPAPFPPQQVISTCHSFSSKPSNQTKQASLLACLHCEVMLAAAKNEANLALKESRKLWRSCPSEGLRIWTARTRSALETCLLRPPANQSIQCMPLCMSQEVGESEPNLLGCLWSCHLLTLARER